MKYMILQYVSHNETFTNVLVSEREDFSTQFPAVVGNPNYDQFLEQAGLTDEEVHALTPDEWIEL